MFSSEIWIPEESATTPGLWLSAFQLEHIRDRNRIKTRGIQERLLALMLLRVSDILGQDFRSKMMSCRIPMNIVFVIQRTLHRRFPEAARRIDKRNLFLATNASDLHGDLPGIKFRRDVVAIPFDRRQFDPGRNVEYYEAATPLPGLLIHLPQ